MGEFWWIKNKETVSYSIVFRTKNGTLFIGDSHCYKDSEIPHYEFIQRVTNLYVEMKIVCNY